MLYFVSSSRFQKPFAMISRLYIYCTYVPAYRIANTIKRVPITTEVALYTITNIFIKRIWKVGGIYIYIAMLRPTRVRDLLTRQIECDTECQMMVIDPDTILISCSAPVLHSPPK